MLIKVSKETTVSTEKDLSNHDFGQDKRKTFNILDSFIDAILKSSFSERDCEGLLDAMRHCGWYRIQDTVGKIESNIPPLPDNVQTRFYGFNIVGDFGDGLYLH